MAKSIYFEVRQNKFGELRRNVPEEVIERGEEAIKNYLINEGHVESCLDYGETETDIIIHEE